jgi:hypothetical protein
MGSSSTATTGAAAGDETTTEVKIYRLEGEFDLKRSNV